MYRVELASRRVQRQLDNIPDPYYGRIFKAIAALADDPRPQTLDIKKLVTGDYRIRVGDYRMVYNIDDKSQLVIIGKVARRTERTYKE